MSGIVAAKKQKPIIVNGVSDHVHVFVGFKPSMHICDLIRDVKNNSSKFINEQKFLNCKFAWQEGYGVFSYSHSHKDRVYRYIANQEAHHCEISFKEEYIDMLKKMKSNTTKSIFLIGLKDLTNHLWAKLCHPFGVLEISVEFNSKIISPLRGYNHATAMGRDRIPQ